MRCRQWTLLSLISAVLVTGAWGQTRLYRLDGTNPGDEFGTAVAVLGDLDGDGADDFAVGAPLEVARTGTLRIVSGRSGTVLKTLSGTGPDDFFGQAVVALGDTDGDQIPDWAVGAPEREFYPGDCTGGSGGGFGASFGNGYVVVYSGATFTPRLTLGGSAGGDAFGFSLGGGGDVDGDGIKDLIVCGADAHVFSGATGGFIRSHSFSSQSGRVYSATVVGRLDGDATDDYALGWIEYFGCLSGGIRTYRGSNGSTIWDDTVCNLGDEYGFSVSAAGDLDGDDVPDVLGGGLDTAGFACTGKSFVRALSGADGSVIYASTGPDDAGRGRALTALGDLDGDGLGEIALGQPGVIFAGPNGDALRIHSGSSDVAVLSVAPDDASDRFGCALSAGDLNGDGLLDLLVGARWDDDGGTNAGAVSVYTLFLGPVTYCEAQVNSQGCTPTISWTGTPSVSASTMRVNATQVINRKNGLLFWGRAPRQTPLGSAFLCADPPLLRTSVQFSAGNPPPADCSGSFSFQFDSGYLAAKGLAAGDDVFCQYWSRDPASASGANLTDALAFTLLP